MEYDLTELFKEYTLIYEKISELATKADNLVSETKGFPDYSLVERIQKNLEKAVDALNFN